MQTATIVVDRDFKVGEVDPRLFGSFIEHLGRAIYGGIYEPGHATADDHGFRQDVLELVRELRTPVVRYPGGNFVSGYNWEDGVGPVSERPRRLDLAWKSTEPNLVGTNEFVTWARLAKSDVMMAVNLGTRDVDAARNHVEYSNHPSGTHWSDLRRTHGYADPHAIKLWCLGNEMDGPWQIGQKTADEYGLIAAQAGKAMKLVDPSIELVVCGSSHPRMASFPEWEATVLEHTYEQVEYISIHNYFSQRDGDIGTFLADSLGMEEFIRIIVSTCDYIGARKRLSKKIQISFDEWNVWYHSQPRDQVTYREQAWAVAPPLTEESYTMVDALAVGTMLIALLKHVDRVKIACIAQLVNAIAPISTVTGGGAWRQTTFYPFLHASTFGRGEVLDLKINAPTYPTERYGEVSMIEAVATVDAERDEWTLFAVNRNQTDALAISVDIRCFSGYQVIEHLVLDNADPNAVNTVEAPNTVRPRVQTGAGITSNTLSAFLPALSWNVIRMGRATK